MSLVGGVFVVAGGGPDGPSAFFLPSFLNDKKTTSPSNDMGIQT
jgi:hypothetical protein